MFRILLIAPLVALVANCTEEGDLAEPQELGAVAESNPVDAPNAAENPSGKHGHFKHGGSVEEHVAFKFDKLDADKDGVITAEETKDNKWFAEKFAVIDADADGKITKEEMTTHVKERFDGKDMPCGMGGHGMHGKLDGEGEPPCMMGHGSKHGGTPEEHVAVVMAKLDTDNDGIISAEEAKGCGKFSSHFEATDADGDGKVTKEELTAFVQQRFENKDMPCMKGEGCKHGDGEPPCMKGEGCKHGDGEPPCMKGHGFGHGHGGSVDEHVSGKFDMLDADKDGVISEEEIKDHKWFAEKFAAADADSDGKITKEELTQFFTDKRAKMQQAAETEN